MKKFLIVPALLLCSVNMMADRKETTWRTWQFSRDGQAWQQVTVPHDWAIAGPFDKKWDLQIVAIRENGEDVPTEKSGRTGALPWIGDGQYKTSYRVDASELTDKRHTLVFDGAMAEPRVFVNGQFAGEWKYGYNSFRVDITPFLKAGDNEVKVLLSNLEESSRWYPGAGIYRPVKLQVTPSVRIDDWSTFFRTEKLSGNAADVTIDTHIDGISGGQDYAVATELLDARGKRVAQTRKNIGSDGNFNAQLKVEKAQLWTPETPYLYTLKVKLFQGKKQIDEQVLKTGIRTVVANKEGGFMLNGVSRKLQGVCLHHDLGPLGAAVNKAALIRQVKLMKEMGADAIRTAHNMPSQMQMEICDSLGMMVMAESFDMWRYAKCKNGYSRFFGEWVDKDMETLVRAHRNHPSIVMWSIGNEIPEQSSEGRVTAEHLQNICHRLDPTRPVTQGMDRAEDALGGGFAQVMDVAGFNYRVHKYPKNITQLPQGFLLGAETASAVSSRGVYKFPMQVSSQLTYPDGQCSSYDTEFCPWSNLPETDFAAMDDLDYTIGQFVWTGFDYLGEPTPYDLYWPSRSSYLGTCDLAGLPKDRYYLYRSQWRKDAHTIHLLPHWTWPGREGEVTPVVCYTDYPTAELFVNGVSQGKITKTTGVSSLDQNKPDLKRYRLIWSDVKYQPGEIKVVVYDKAGKAAGEQTVKTAGQPAKIVLDADRTVLQADGDDMAFVTVSLEDAAGTLCPDADDELFFEVDGAGSYQAVCNGDATSLESFADPHMHLFHGKLVVVVRAADKSGKLTLKVKCPKRNLERSLTIAVKK